MPQTLTSRSAWGLSFCRFCILLCRTDTFESRARELTDHLCKRGYQKQEISLAIERARQQKREDLLSYRLKSESNVLPFVLTYHPDLPKVREIINKHWPIIESSSTLSEIFTERPTMAYRRPKSLRDLLVRAKLKPDMRDDEPLGETRPCGKARCKTCKIAYMDTVVLIVKISFIRLGWS